MNIKSLKFVGITVLTFLLSSCDLGLQEEFDFKPEALSENPFENMTAWEWIQTRTTAPTATTYNALEFDYFIEAIKKAGMQNEYDQIATKDRTYLLLNNNAFIGAGDIIQIVTGSATVPAGEKADVTMNKVDTPAELAKLKAVLSYHIVTTYILQVPTLYKYDVDYLFQTLIPGNDGLIAFRRSPIYQITVNSQLAPLPKTATDEFEGCLSHNYQFKNGIGHVLADPVRNKPY